MIEVSLWGFPGGVKRSRERWRVGEGVSLSALYRSWFGLWILRGRLELGRCEMESN